MILDSIEIKEPNRKCMQMISNSIYKKKKSMHDFQCPHSIIEMKPKYQQETKYNGVKMDVHEVCSDYT